jgi:hypothetical protein
VIGGSTLMKTISLSSFRPASSDRLNKESEPTCHRVFFPSELADRVCGDRAVLRLLVKH